MTKDRFIEVFRASCGSGGCDNREYLLPNAGTREEFLKAIKKAKELNKVANS